MDTVNLDSQQNDIFNEIQADALDRLLRGRGGTGSESSNLYIQREVLPPDTIILPRLKRIHVKEPSVMVFADNMPFANWSHPCHYLFYQLESKTVREVPSTLPPYLTEFPETFQMFFRGSSFDHRIAAEEVPIPGPTEQRKPIGEPAGNRYAILFSGSSNYQHVNDLEFLYRTLLNTYEYLEDHIYVLNFDGTLGYGPVWSGGPPTIGYWPGDNTPFRMRVSASGTKSDFEAVIDDLKNRIGRDDSLLIHTSNHGNNSYPSLHPQAESSLIDFNQSDYYASDFASKIAELPRFHSLVVMMEQCNSGGFKRHILNIATADLISFASACGEFAPSYQEPHFDAFACSWIAAMNGADPFNAALHFNPDVDGNGGVTSREAFDYANHRLVVHPYDTPEYDESSASAGDYRLDQ